MHGCGMAPMRITGNLLKLVVRIAIWPVLSCRNRSEKLVWIRGIAGVVLCALGAVWIAQGSGAMNGSSMSGHGQFALLGAAAVIVGVVLLIWAVRIRRRQAHI